MKRSRVCSLLSYFWLVMSVTYLMRFMATPELNFRVWGAFALSLFMFWYNSTMSSRFQASEKAAEKSENKTSQ